MEHGITLSPMEACMLAGLKIRVSGIGWTAAALWQRAQGPSMAFVEFSGAMDSATKLAGKIHPSILRSVLDCSAA